MRFYRSLNLQYLTKETKEAEKEVKRFPLKYSHLFLRREYFKIKRADTIDSRLLTIGNLGENSQP